MPGIFITFEGGEGAGKTTQIRLLQEYLNSQSKEVILTREPGGTPAAEAIRPLLVSGHYNWDSMSEILLFSAARRHHLQNVIWPALEQGKVVLCDRFADSTLAYQGYGRGDNPELCGKLKQLYQMIAGNFMPDLTFILDIDPKIGLKRSMERSGNTEQRFEQMDITFHENLRRGFLTIAHENPKRCIVLNANQDVKKLHQEIIQKIQEKLCQI